METLLKLKEDLVNTSGATLFPNEGLTDTYVTTRYSLPVIDPYFSERVLQYPLQGQWLWVIEESARPKYFDTTLSYLTPGFGAISHAFKKQESIMVCYHGLVEGSTCHFEQKMQEKWQVAGPPDSTWVVSTWVGRKEYIISQLITTKQEIQKLLRNMINGKPVEMSDQSEMLAQKVASQIQEKIRASKINRAKRLANYIGNYTD